MRPPARPWRATGTCGNTVGAASTMSAPPASPEAKRQTKNQAKENGTAQAKKAAVASSSIALSNRGAGARAASGRPSSAPAR